MRNGVKRLERWKIKTREPNENETFIDNLKVAIDYLEGAECDLTYPLFRDLNSETKNQIIYIINDVKNILNLVQNGILIIEKPVKIEEEMM